MNLDKLDRIGTEKTPTINFDAEKGLVELKGRSIPENSIAFYEPLLEWLEEYSEVAIQKTTANIFLEYFNTASSKCVLDIFRSLASIHEADDDKEVFVNWYYEKFDDDMLEVAGDYQALVNLPFKVIEVEVEEE